MQCRGQLGWLMSGLEEAEADVPEMWEVLSPVFALCL